MDGVINVNKSSGITSFGVVSKIKKIFGTKKVGHTGTLDPQAEGVLPICIGKATKAVELLTGADKAYTARIRLGMTTDTQDIWGTAITQSAVHLTRQELEKALASFRGNIMQLPPMYSAIRIDGKRLYELARQGLEVERTPRQVCIHSLELTDFDGCEGSLQVVCSKGTYIRTLCSDIGQILGCGAVMSSLTRTRSGMFLLQDAMTLLQIEQQVQKEGAQKCLIPVDKLFETYPALHMNKEDESLIRCGCAIRMGDFLPGTYRAYGENEIFLGVGETRGEIGMQTFHMVKRFFGG